MDGPNREVKVQSRPRVLMLSHCLPLADGSKEQRRAASLLKVISQDDDVSLACISNEQVRFGQWSAAYDLCGQFVIHRPGTIDRRLAAFGRNWDPTVATSRMFDRIIGRTIDMWLANESFDGVLATHPCFWNIARRVRTRALLVDFQAMGSALIDGRTSKSVFARRRQEQWTRFGRYIAQRCSIAIVDNRQTAHALAGTCHNTQTISDGPEPLQIERVRSLLNVMIPPESQLPQASAKDVELRRAA